MNLDAATLQPSTSAAGAARAAARVLAGAVAATLLLMLPPTMLVPVLRELGERLFGGSPTLAHTFVSINLLGATLAAPLGGMLADRLAVRRRIALIALLADAALVAAMARSESPVAMLVMRFLQGAAHMISLTTLLAIVADWSALTGRARAIGAAGSAIIFGTTLGTPLGGRIGAIDTSYVFFAGAAALVLAFIVVGVLVKDAPQLRPATSFRSAFAFLRSEPRLWAPYALSYIERLGVGVIISSLILYLGQTLHMDPAQIGLLMSCFLLPFALGCYPMGLLIDRIDHERVMIVACVLYGLVFACYGWLPAALLPAAMVVSGVLSAAMYVPNLVMCSRLAGPEQRATVMAGFNLAGSLGFLTGPLLATGIVWLGRALGRPDPPYAAIFGVVGVLTSLVGLACLALLRRRG